MSEFRYRAVTVQGELVSGDAVAVDKQALARRLAERGQTLLSVRSRHSLHRAGLSAVQRLMWYQEMTVLLSAGLPLHDALAHSALGTSRAARCSRSLAELLAAGQPLSAAVSDHPETFSPMACAFIRSGEATGDMAKAIDHLAELEAWWYRLRQRVRRACAYPIATLAVLAVVVPTVLVFLVPQLLGLITVLGTTLPWYTHALLALSDWAVDFGLVAVGCLVAVVAAAYWCCAPGRPLELVWARTAIRFPVVGPLIYQAQLALCCRQVAELYRAGLPLDAALNLASESASNLVIKRAFAGAAVAVQSGQPVNLALERQMAFPALLVQLARTGEHSGCLDETLLQASTVFGREADRKADQLAAAVGPILLLGVAGLIGWVVAAVLLPLYDSLFNVGGVL